MKKYFLFIIGFSVLVGCQKAEQIPSPEQPETVLKQLPNTFQVLKLLQEPVNGYFSITSAATLAVQHLRGPEIILGGYMDDSKGIRADFGRLTCENLFLNADPAQGYNYGEIVGPAGALGFYGDDVTVSLEGSGKMPGLRPTDFYVPELMTVSDPVFSNHMTISAGQTIVWNADSKNTIGVGISIEFNPDNPANVNFKGDPVVTEILTEDDGSYTITSDDLAGIPLGGTINFVIGRGNYERATLNDPDYHIGLYAYSAITKSMIVK